MDDPLAILTANRPQPEHHPRPQLWALILAVLALMVIAVLVLGPAPAPGGEPVATPSESPESREARVYTVSYRFGVFSPTNLRIHVGDTVRFRNDSVQPVRITAESLPGATVPEFDSVGPVQPGGYFSYTFATPGIFGYHDYADTDRAGVIIVRE